MNRLFAMLLVLSASLNAATTEDDFRQSPFYPLALAMITKDQAQLPLIGLEWDMLSAEQRRLVVERVKWMTQKQKELEEQIEFTEGLIRRFDQASLDPKNFDQLKGVLPNLQEALERDLDDSSRLPQRRRAYVLRIAKVLALVIARLDDPRLNKDDLRALAERLRIEFELALHFTTEQPELVAQETARFWFGGMFAGFTLSGLSAFDPTHALMYAGSALSVASVIGVIWNIQARDEGALSPLGKLPGANERSAAKVRGRLREVFWTEVQAKMMVHASLWKWNRGKVPAKDFPTVITKLIEGSRADLNKIDCRAILSTPLLKQ